MKKLPAYTETQVNGLLDLVNRYKQERDDLAFQISMIRILLTSSALELEERSLDLTILFPAL
jgi:hypothetical protein